MHPPRSLRDILFWSAVAGVLLAGISIRVHHLYTVESRTPDEQQYTYFGATLASRGLGATADLVREFNGTEARWKLPPPTRVGYTGLLAAVMTATGIRDPWAGACLSSVCSVLSLCVLLVAGIRFAGRWATLPALLLYMHSPLSLVLARRAWQDEVVTLLGAATLYLCGEAVSAGRRTPWYALAAFAGALTLLVKESGALLFGLGFLWLFWDAWQRGCIRKDGAWVAAFGLGFAILSVLMAVFLSGGLTPWLDVYRNVRRSFASNAYVLNQQTGAWWEYLWTLYVMVPVSATLFCVGTLSACWQTARPDQKQAQAAPALRGLALVVLVFLGACASAPYLKNLRFASAVFVPFYLLAGLGASRLFGAVRHVSSPRLALAVRACVAGVVLLGVLADYASFHRLRDWTDGRDLALGKIRAVYSVSPRSVLRRVSWALE